jgi:hypothetical protein
MRQSATGPVGRFGHAPEGQRRAHLTRGLNWPSSERGVWLGNALVALALWCVVRACRLQPPTTAHCSGSGADVEIT